MCDFKIKCSKKNFKTARYCLAHLPIIWDERLYAEAMAKYGGDTPAAVARAAIAAEKKNGETLGTIVERCGLSTAVLSDATDYKFSLGPEWGNWRTH